ncbi:hypothetical protein [Alkalimarinus coralli]|uniref:hypothetical protein n=1 Tax=Alkalimarinus coralli TaxID=2935863 RepID=UPI00202B9398|nr:hypothetical protein [Alkalimarinus coralli]
MDIYEREYVAAVINYFWGPNLTNAHSVNEPAAQIAFEALAKANVCSDSMDLVPRPTLIASPGYVVKQLSKIGKRIISGDTSIYNLCKGAVGMGYKSHIQIALMGG